MKQPEKGKILISAPYLSDIFKRTVIYMTEHDEKGSVGFILNKPTKYNINEIIDDFPEFKAKVHLGGPVQPELVNFIHSSGDILPDGYEIAEGVFWNGNFELLKNLIIENKIFPVDIKFFLGYSGWSSGQLGDELLRNSWFVNDAKEDYLFSLEEDKLWRTTLKDMGHEYALIASFPDDPSMN